MNQFVTVEDILASAKKYGNDSVLTWDPEKYRDSKQHSKTSKYDCTWLQFRFKKVSGDSVPLTLKFNKVLTGSQAKMPAMQNEFKHLQIVFRKFELDDILKGDYAPKAMDDPESQAAEDARATKIAESYKDSTDKFVDAMLIIDQSYRKLCSEILQAKKLPFSVRKKSKRNAPADNSDIEVFRIVQTTRQDQDNPGSEIELESPLVRIKLLMNKEGKIGAEMWNRDLNKRVFIPNVYNSRKKDANGNPVIAQIKSGKKLVPLDHENAKSFITYKSIVGGMIQFQDITISTAGLSLQNNFKSLYVVTNKSKSANNDFTNEDLQDMVQGMNLKDDESDIEL